MKEELVYNVILPEMEDFSLFWQEEYYAITPVKKEICLSKRDFFLAPSDSAFTFFIALLKGIEN